MKAISIRQPWAWLIVHGFKDIENRTRNYNFTGRILIHTGSQPDPKIDYLRALYAAERGIQIPHTLQYGGIIGEAEITETVTESESKWFTGPFGLIIANPKPYRFKIPKKGNLGIFNV